MDAVELVLRKYDGRPHRRVTGHLLGTDKFGTWIGTPRGTLVTYSYGWRRRERTREDSVRLIPATGWWMAMFSAAPARAEIYCDVTTPAEQTGPAQFTVIDLDIDVLRMRPDGRVLIDDEDEFTHNRTRFAYPPDVVEQALAATAELSSGLATNTEPFATHYQTWLSPKT
ncbi:DUF402 domain-containing protein [Actinoplanes sp. DH11]|uniref:DUF402 domain-containing protein n=1 Tax=Actinoplanes sp. DH11 TaxID=2857011 RepID=UPI001E3C5375|nr:DUF402 domain-containing protein [Actinoplanes sp. DH11]